MTPSVSGFMRAFGTDQSMGCYDDMEFNQRENKNVNSVCELLQSV